MKILFVNLSSVKFTTETPDHAPLGGTESCIAYLCREFAKNNHAVALLCQLPDNAPADLQGVTHFPLSILRDQDFFKSNAFDIIIACNAPTLCPILKALSPQARILLWDHVPPEQPSIKDLGDEDVLASIEAIIYVSTWQQKQTEKHFNIQKLSYVIGNGLTPAFENMFATPDEIYHHKRNRAAYTTIPYRGLQILLSVMEDFPEDTELDLFSSMRVYQLDDHQYKTLFDKASLNPRIKSYGSVSQLQLSQHLKTSAFLAYPCICAETFCIGVLEALAAGMKVITTSQGALPTTTMGYADLVDVHSDRADDLILDYRSAMIRNIQDFKKSPHEWAQQRYSQVQSVNRDTTWRERFKTWEKIIHKNY